MSLEQVIAANTEALLAQNALLTKLLERGVDAPAAQPTDKPAATGKKPPKEDPKPSDTSGTSQASSKKSDEPPAAGATPEAAGDAPSVDYETVKNAVLEVSKKSRATPAESREQAEALLQRFGVQKISQLGAAVYDEVYAFAQKVLAGEIDATAAELPAGAESLE